MLDVNVLIYDMYWNELDWFSHLSKQTCHNVTFVKSNVSIFAFKKLNLTIVYIDFSGKFTNFHRCWDELSKLNMYENELDHCSHISNCTWHVL